MEFGAGSDKRIVPLAWLTGRWVGVGVMGYPRQSDIQFGQEVEFADTGTGALWYRSQLWALDDSGNKGDVLEEESGYWRAVLPDVIEESPAAEGLDIEIVLTQDAGSVELYLGRVGGGKVEVATDLVARTPTSTAHSAAKRMYGLVEGDLMWVVDVATGDGSFASHASARLKKA